MRRPRTYACLPLALVLAAGGCSASADAGGGSSESGSGATGGVGGSGSGGIGITGGTGGGVAPPVLAELTGTVVAPEGTIPISGALVYLADAPPEPIPQGVYCDKCIELENDDEYALSAADGSFTLEAHATGSKYLVVQKGAFRRVRQIEIAGGDNALDISLTTLPGRSDPANGDDIPKMAVLQGEYDAIENTLGKLGLGQVDGSGTLIQGSESFTLVPHPPIFAFPPPADQRVAWLQDPSKLNDYHIVFFPCATEWPDGYITQPGVKQALLDYMNAGGRIYATDYSYDVLRQMFPEPISWLYDNGSLGSAEAGIYDAPAIVDDSGLGDWLGAQGINQFSIEDNWTTISQVNPYTAPDEDGMSTMLNPTVWVSGNIAGSGIRPSTVSYQYGCGRALFSTYHTESGGGAGLLAQERALLYMVLEVAVCLGDLPPPPT